MWSQAVGNGRVALEVLLKAATIVCMIAGALWVALDAVGVRLNLPWSGHV